MIDFLRGYLGLEGHLCWATDSEFLEIRFVSKCKWVKIFLGNVSDLKKIILYSQGS